ncbi:MAG: YraN family protein [Bacteroidetes bacterium]|nr:YraN family protein [Bacteroidota bacterium]
MSTDLPPITGDHSGSPATRTTGTRAEQFAAGWLEKQGHRILDRNFQFGHTEIDIITEYKGMLVFTEVKYRASTHLGHPFQQVNRKKIQNLFFAAEGYLIRNPQWKGRDIRMDVLSLTGNLDNPDVEAFENITQWL